LPTYAFDRQRYVLPIRAPAGGGQVRVPAIPELGGTSTRGGDNERLEVPELIHRQLAMMTEQLAALGQWQTRNGNSS
jgi:hypothetical protein